jgi:hypothetical protein
LSANFQAPVSGSRINPLAAVILVRQADAQQLCLRLFGSLAIWHHCPSLRGRIESDRPRAFKDMDFVGLLAERRAVQAFFERRGWETDKDLAMVPGARSGIFYRKHAGRVVARCDMSYDILDFCHRIDCEKRLRVDPVTLPLAELALSKLQVSELSMNDIFDLTMLFLDHDVAAGDVETINIGIIERHCLASWGLYTTLIGNVTVLLNALAKAEWLSQTERDVVRDRLGRMSAAVTAAPKGLRWRLRALVGTRLRWYEEVEAAGINVGEALPS